MNRFLRPRVQALPLVLCLLITLGTHVFGAEREVRAIWVTRWDYKTPADVQLIISNSAALRFNVVLFQVRGNGTVFYPSEIEPWAWELTSEGPETTGRDPGWDPLKLAITEAHRQGLELHAYVNVFPAWRSQDFPPCDSGQLWWEHPDWFMCDAAGERMIPRDAERDEHVTRDWYSFISPGVPEVQDYLTEVFTELVENYAVDGLHYDYIRYPREIREVKEGFEERARRLGNWSYDSVSLARFSAETGIAAPDLDLEAWIEWRAAQITELTHKVSERVRLLRPDLIISASVMADPEDAYRTKMQDYVRWLKLGYLDAAITMNYTGNNDTFRERCVALLEKRPERGWVVPGLTLGSNADTIRAQIDIAAELGADGFSGFAYSHLFDRDHGHVRRALADALAEELNPGIVKTPWKDDTVQVIPATTELFAAAARSGDPIRTLMNAARPAIGTPYEWGGVDLENGVDCSGFTWQLFEKAGLGYERYLDTRQLSQIDTSEGLREVSIDDARPGDLLVYGYTDETNGWHGHVVVLVDKDGSNTGHAGLVLGSHGPPVNAVQFITYNGFEEGFYRTPKRQLHKVLRVESAP